MRPAGAGNTKRTAQAIQQKLDRLDEAFLFAVFGPDAARARALYDPRGDQTLEELLVQVFMDNTMTEPARYLANELARAGQSVWLYRFAYVSQAQRGELMGTMHAFEIPFTLNIPGVLVGADKVTPTDKLMGDLTSAYWAQFGKCPPCAQ